MRLQAAGNSSLKYCRCKNKQLVTRPQQSPLVTYPQQQGVARPQQSLVTYPQEQPINGEFGFAKKIKEAKLRLYEESILEIESDDSLD